MKKSFLICLYLVVFSFLLGGCGLEPSGRKSELLSRAWSATLDSGAKVSLSFTDETANFAVENEDKITKISGRYIADDSTFVIFMPEIYRNYGFSYKPKGKLLELEYNGNTITLK